MRQIGILARAMNPGDAARGTGARLAAAAAAVKARARGRGFIRRRAAPETGWQMMRAMPR
jgi:hypothetical protein